MQRLTYRVSMNRSHYYEKRLYPGRDCIQEETVPIYYGKRPYQLCLLCGACALISLPDQLVCERNCVSACVQYSKTSNNGLSEKRTTSVQRTAHMPPIDFTIELRDRLSSHNSMRLRHKASCGSSPRPPHNRDNPLST